MNNTVSFASSFYFNHARRRYRWHQLPPLKVSIERILTDRETQTGTIVITRRSVEDVVSPTPVDDRHCGNAAAFVYSLREVVHASLRH